MHYVLLDKSDCIIVFNNDQYLADHNFFVSLVIFLYGNLLCCFGKKGSLMYVKKTEHFTIMNIILSTAF